MKLSIVIPAHNEEGNITNTVQAICDRLHEATIDYEVVIVNDNSTDQTALMVEALQADNDKIRLVHNTPPNGFGFAVRKGIEHIEGDAITIVMADGSDDPGDIVTYYHKLQEGYECVFGSRFLRDSKVENYPYHKLLLNRLANLFIRLLYGLHYNDVTNAFKCYRTEVISGIQPLLSHHFNLTVEMPLKAIVRGYTYTVVPICWYGRIHGISKLKIKEMGSRYLFIVLYVLFEKWLSKGDYHRSRQMKIFDSST